MSPHRSSLLQSICHQWTARLCRAPGLKGSRSVISHFLDGRSGRGGNNYHLLLEAETIKVEIIDSCLAKRLILREKLPTIPQRQLKI